MSDDIEADTNSVSSSDGDSSEADLDIESFLPILDVIDLDALTFATLRVRKSRLHNLHTPSKYLSQDLTCTAQTPPLVGSYNIACVLQFSDDVKWIARLPGNGVTSFGDLHP